MIKSGNVVKLKSGGPKMTVRNHHDGPLWVCSWFDGVELKEGYFSEEQLEILS